MIPAADIILASLRPQLDAAAILSGDDVDARYGDDLASPGAARPALVLRPRSTADVSVILKTFNAAGLPLTIQGGRTGLSGAARPLAGEAVLSLERMARVEPVDALAATVVAQAGAPLQAVQEAAEAAGFSFGVDIGARGTATVGGNVATNAGGVRVLRYGMFRQQVLGLEAVLADGTVVSSMRGLAKDNSGYDLTQIFVGSEGTLGAVTRVCLRLHPKPVEQAAAFCALPSPEAALALLRLMRGRTGPLLSAFEVILAPLYREMTEASGLDMPVGDAPVHALVEMHGFAPEADRSVFAAALEEALEAGLVTDAVLSRSQREVDAFWRLRDECSRFIFAQGPAVGLDLSLPLARLGDFLARAEAATRGLDPAARLYAFGHLGDGNIHYIAVTREHDAVSAALHRLAAEAGGSISAEHGVGLMKKAYLPLMRSPQELAAMRRLKAAFDPNNILNRGRIFDMTPEPG